jgi:hypothetical protein
MLRLSGWLAIAVGLALAAGQAVRNYDNLQNWPGWGIDIAAGLILLYGGWRSLKRRSDRSLAAAWGFAAGLFLSAFVSHAQAVMTADSHGEFYASEQRLVLIIAALSLTSAAGLVMSLLGRKGG